MAVTDKKRYNTTDPTTDIPGLGKNPDLKPLNKQLVRQQLSMIETDSIPDRERAIHILLSRISDYYELIGYVGPYMSGRSELGFALGEWLQEPGHEPWREAFCTTNRSGRSVMPSSSIAATIGLILEIGSAPRA